MIIVADSSPLISFAILNLLDILPEIFEKIQIPQSVYEITNWQKPFANQLKQFATDRVSVVQNKIAVEVLLKDLDLGESEAIVLALENSIWDILIDEHKGRRIARLHGLNPIGTLGVLIQSKRVHLIKKVKPLLNILIANKIRISKPLYLKTLELANEK